MTPRGSSVFDILLDTVDDDDDWDYVGYTGGESVPFAHVMGCL